MNPSRDGRAPDALIARPVRDQFEMSVAYTLDQRIAADHAVRAIWSVIETLDLSLLESQVESNTRQGGRPAVDPRIILALWVYGTTQGIASAAEIARRTRSDDAFRWICGGVTVSDRTLTGFRVEQEKAFDAILTQVIAVLMKEELVEVSRIAQDGTRVRASAGTGSFRRLATLEQALKAAHEHVEETKKVAHDGQRTTAERAAAERAAKDRVSRIKRARDLVQKLAEEKGLSEEQIADKKKAPRASMTDPDARPMKMGDGGFRPAYNVNFATAADGSGVLLGVYVTQRGSDQGEATPMRAQVEARTSEDVIEQLVDAGYASHAEVEKATESDTKLYAPLPKKLAEPGSRRESEYSDASRDWIERMQSEQGKTIYKKRSEVAELTNARAKSRFGLSMLLVRGLRAVTCVALLVAITNDITALISARQRAAEGSTETSSPCCEPGA